VFDLVTFAGLWWLFRAGERAFHTGRFVESLFTQTLVLLVIRTAGNPFRSRPSPWLLAAALGVCGVAVLLPFAPFAAALGFEPFPAGFSCCSWWRSRRPTWGAWRWRSGGSSAGRTSGDPGVRAPHAAHDRVCGGAHPHPPI
jgi:hypothetical protein